MRPELISGGNAPKSISLCTSPVSDGLGFQATVGRPITVGLTPYRGTPMPPPFPAVAANGIPAGMAVAGVLCGAGAVQPAVAPELAGAGAAPPAQLGGTDNELTKAG